MSYNYAVTQDAVRVELYLSTGSREKNKALFDQLREHREIVEQRFGGALEWHRSDDNNSSRITCLIPKGGWVDRQSWDAAIQSAVDAMIRLHAALQPEIERLEVRA